MTAGDALDVTFAWLEVNSGWAPPDPETLQEWLADGGCRAPDDCWIASERFCEHGLVSWQRVLAVVDDR